jgi:deoxyribonuclease IV
VRIGIHTSIAGALENAALHAAKLGANTFQIFSASPRMWRAGPLDPAAVERFRATRARLKLAPLVVHDNYLINLAAADAGIRAKSVAAFRGEAERAAELGAEYLVMHPGSYKGYGLEDGIGTLAGSLGRALDGFDGRGLTLLLENTAGSGSALGSRFEELAEIRARAAGRIPIEIGYCLDTAHCLAVGYDIASEDGLPRTVCEISRVLEMDRVRVIHTNDSKAPLGSHVDRHEHIGKGYIGAEGFRRILAHPQLRPKAFILETPIERDGDDRRNVRALLRLAG